MKAIKSNHSPRVLYVGAPCELARAPLQALLNTGVEVCGLVVPAVPGAPPITRLPAPPARSPLPIARRFVSHGMVEIAWEHTIPVYTVGNLSDSAVAAALAALEPDIACAACFPRRIPADLLRLPLLGWLNIHPSLLPAYRGPAPLFWALRNGETRIGVTVHAMEQDFDTGDIIVQAPLVLPEGAGGAQIDMICGALGGGLLVQALQRFAQGDLERRPQPSGGSYHRWPAPEDWTVSTDWPARRAFNFIRGTDDWGQIYKLLVGGEQLTLAVADSYDPSETLGAPLARDGRKIAIQCTPGVLRAREADSCHVHGR